MNADYACNVCLSRAGFLSAQDVLQTAQHPKVRKLITYPAHELKRLREQHGVADPDIRDSSAS